MPQEPCRLFRWCQPYVLKKDTALLVLSTMRVHNLRHVHKNSLLHHLCTNVVNTRISFFAEMYNTYEPFRKEYFQMTYINDKFSMSVSNESYFLQHYQPEIYSTFFRPIKKKYISKNIVHKKKLKSYPTKTDWLICTTPVTIMKLLSILRI